MQIVYTPEGATPHVWDWRPRKLRSAETEVIEQRAGTRFEAWIDDCFNGGAKAMHAFLYVMLRRDNPTLTWDQVDFSPDEIVWRLDQDEANAERAGLEALAKAGTLRPEQQQLLALFREQTPEFDHQYRDDEPVEADASDPTQGWLPSELDEPLPIDLSGNSSDGQISEPDTSGTSPHTSTSHPTNMIG